MLATWDPHEIYMLIDFPGWELPGQTGPIIEARRECGWRTLKARKLQPIRMQVA
jgi:hypothetical protein